MNKIAIDVVLIPDDKTIETCKEINKNLTSEIDFNNTGKTPHISLLMGVMNQSDLDQISKIVSEIGQNNLPVDLNCVVDNYFSETSQMNIPFMKINQNKTIGDIALALEQKVQPLLDYQRVDKTMFFQSDTIGQSSIDWVKGYGEKTTEQRGEHITLGVGESEEHVGNTYSGSSYRIAIYQLGPHCTCENKLFEFSL